MKTFTKLAIVLLRHLYRGIQKHPLPPAGAETRPSDAKRDEDLRTAYLAAINLWTHGSQLVRERFNALLLANSITLLGIVYSLTGSSQLRTSAIGMSLAGLAICLLGFLSMRRSRDLLEHYRDHAIAIERHLSGVHTAAQGKRFARGETVTLLSQRDGGGAPRVREQQIGRFGRLVPAGRSESLILLVFAIVYVILLIEAWMLDGSVGWRDHVCSVLP